MLAIAWKDNLHFTVLMTQKRSLFKGFLWFPPVIAMSVYFHLAKRSISLCRFYLYIRLIYPKPSCSSPVDTINICPVTSFLESHGDGDKHTFLSKRVCLKRGEPSQQVVLVWACLSIPKRVPLASKQGHGRETYCSRRGFDSSPPPPPH